MRKYLFNFYLILIPLTGLSRQPDSTDFTTNSYYVSLKEELSIHVYGITKFNNIELRNPSSDTVIRYQPNENFNIGAGFNYKWAGISGAFNFKFINNDDRIYGKTTSFDLQSDIYTRKFIWTVNLQSYNGFYWGNVNVFDSTWSIRDSVPLRPDITTVNLGASMIYTFNHEKFSFKAPYVYTERQIRTAGSWLYGVHASFYAISAVSALIPENLQPAFPLYDSLATLSTVNTGSSIGYSYTWVFFKQFYINGTLMLGLSLQAVAAYDIYGNALIEKVRASSRSHIRLSIGANNERCYYGISVIIDSYPIRNEFQSSFVYNYGKFRIYYGRHLNWELKKKQQGY